MKTAILALILIFTGLFVLTTFPQSSTAKARAIEEKFAEDEIEENWQLAVQRKLIYWSDTFITLFFLMALACTSRARKLADWFDARTGQRWWLTVLLMGAFCFLVERALLFPLRIVSLENWRWWGMTERSFLDWLGDYGLALAVSAGMGLILLFGLYALLRWFPRDWWILAGALGGLVAIGFTFILPLWISPLFNTFTPLKEYTQLEKTKRDRLEHSIRELADRADVPVQEIWVMDASRQGRHTNAYFTGFGASRQIVVYDTLLKSHPVEEVEIIIAHEIGHWQHHHILIGLSLGIAGSFVGLFLLSWILRWAVNRPPFRLKSPADPAGLPLILLLSFLASWPIMPLSNVISRYFERQADMASLNLTRQPDVFMEAERRLARDNKSNLAPPPVSVWLFATHPSVIERIQMAKEWKEQQNP